MSQLQRDLTRISHNTKIVATLGPGSNNVQLLEDMIRVGGLNVVRFNFSHGTPEFHEENARIVREAAKRAGQEVAILADLQGPKIRVGKIAGGSIELNKDETLILDAALKGEGTREAVGLDYRDLPNDVATGDVLWLDDGLLTLTVEAVEGSKIITRVENSHVLKSNKGINERGGGLSAGALTEKDFRDLKTAIAIGCDYLAISFVKSAEDLHIARAKVEEEMKGSTAVRPGLVSKIERVEAIENLSDAEVATFLHEKWIEPVCNGIDDTLRSVLATLETSVVALNKKYAVSYKQINDDFASTNKELAGLIDQLTGDERAIEGLKELIKE